MALPEPLPRSGLRECSTAPAQVGELVRSAASQVRPGEVGAGPCRAPARRLHRRSKPAQVGAGRSPALRPRSGTATHRPSWRQSIPPPPAGRKRQAAHAAPWSARPHTTCWGVAPVRIEGRERDGHPRSRPNSARRSAPAYQYSTSLDGLAVTTSRRRELLSRILRSISSATSSATSRGSAALEWTVREPMTD